MLAILLFTHWSNFAIGIDGHILLVAKGRALLGDGTDNRLARLKSTFLSLNVSVLRPSGDTEFRRRTALFDRLLSKI